MEDINREITHNWKEIIKREACALSIPIVSLIYPQLNINRGDNSSVLTFVDSAIPFNKYFIVPYLSWYFYVAVFLTILCIVDGERYFRLLLSLNIGMLICYGIYYIFPTYVPRPKVVGNDLFSNLVLNLYERDNPYNCFPSIHVLNSMLVSIYICSEEKLNRVVKFICFFIGLMIILSTMFIKQHYFADVISALIMGILLYLFMEFVSIKKNKKHKEIYEEQQTVNKAL